MTTYRSPACHDCGTRGNICRDADGIERCRWCSHAAYLERLAAESRALTEGPQGIAALASGRYS